MSEVVEILVLELSSVEICILSSCTNLQYSHNECLVRLVLNLGEC